MRDSQDLIFTLGRWIGSSCRRRLSAADGANQGMDSLERSIAVGWPEVETACHNLLLGQREATNADIHGCVAAK